MSLKMQREIERLAERIDKIEPELREAKARIKSLEAGDPPDPIPIPPFPRILEQLGFERPKETSHDLANT